MCWSDLEHCFDLLFSFVCLQWRTLQTCHPHLLRPQQQSILGLLIKVGSRFLCVWREVRWETHWKNLNTFFPMSIPVAFWPRLEWGHSIWGHLLVPPLLVPLILPMSQCPTDAHAPMICGASPKIDGVVFAGSTLPPLLTSFKSTSSSSSSTSSS